MADEVPEGQLPDPGANTEPEAAWWPWPETHADEPSGPRDGAPGDDDTLSFPVEDATETMAAQPAPDAPLPDAPLPAPPQPSDPEPSDPEPDPVTDPEPEPGESGAGPDPTPRPVEPVAGLPVVLAGATTAPARTAESSWVVPVAIDHPDPLRDATPAVAPAAGSAPIGSIPAARARAVWSRMQASNWRLFLIRFLSAGLAVVLTVAIVPGLGFNGWRWGDFTRIAVIFGLLNATVKPLLQFLVLRFIFSTYGIVVVIINTLLLVLLAAILEDTFEATRPLSVLFGGLVVGVLGLILETLLGATPPTLDRDYKERNGLS